MPSEIRYIVFNNGEIIQALQTYMRRMSKPLPAGSILSCGPERDKVSGSTRFRITLAPDQSNHQPLDRMERCDVVVEGPSLAAALILHCARLRIPLPARAEKSLSLADGHLCLVAAICPKEGAVDLRQFHLGPVSPSLGH